MNKESFFGLGLAFVCNFDGKVIEVAWDDFGIEKKLLEPAHFVCVFDAASVKKGLNFFLEVKEHGAAFDWEIDVSVDERPRALIFPLFPWGTGLWCLHRYRARETTRSTTG